MGSRKPLPAAAARQDTGHSERLDNFVDGAFAFAITLLVISGSSIPHSVPELVNALRGVPAFAACFAQLAAFWHGHLRWRQTMDRTDNKGLLLSLLLVFFALIFVFPLHLVYAGFFHSVSSGALSPDFVPTPGDDTHQMALLFACYGVSYACMGGTLSALFGHNARLMGAPASDRTIRVRMRAVFWACFAVVGLVSMGIALVGGMADAPALIAVAGFSYSLLALVGFVMNTYRKHCKKEVAVS